ncbi:unnamed protein product [Cunninghamella echinulata]
MSQVNYYSDNYPLFDIYNKYQYQTLIKESCNKDSNIDRNFKETVPYYSFNEKVNRIKMIPPSTTSIKRSHPAKYKNHAFSTQLRQKIIAHKRQQRFEKLNHLQQEKKKKKMMMMKKKHTSSIHPATTAATESRTCHAFSSQLYLKLKQNCLSNESSLAT